MTFARNAGPEFNLTEDPWIPLTRLGEARPELVGLREALSDAPQFSALAEGNPITNAALLRFLTAMAYLVVDEASEHDPRVARRQLRAARNAGSGFHRDAVEMVLEQWSDRLWLFHPQHPFCQDPRLAEDTSMPAPLGPLAVTPYLPGDSSAAWGVNLTDARSVGLDEAARLLLANWFYTPAGNSARRTCPDSGIQSKRVASASGANFPSLTNIFRAGANLFETLAGNLVSRHLPAGDPDAVPAFLRVSELTLLLEQIPPLYGATLSAATALIIGSNSGDTRLAANFLRGSTLFDGSYDNVAKRFTDLGLSHDPHVLYVENPQNKPNHPRQNVSGSLTSLPRFSLDVANKIVEDGLPKPGVFGRRNTLLPRDGPNDLLFVQIVQGGTASNRTIAGVETIRIAAGDVSPYSAIDDDSAMAEANRQVALVLEPLLAPTQSALSALRQGVRQAIDPEARSIPAALLDALRDDFYAAIGMSVNDAIRGVTNGTATPERAEARRAQWIGEVLSVFERHAGVYRYSQSSASRYWRARSALTTKLRKVLS